MVRGKASPVFDFRVADYSGWNQVLGLRAQIAVVLGLLRDPCLGQRLRQMPTAASSTWRWDQFCKFDLDGLDRIVYRWIAEEATVVIEAIGPHLRRHPNNPYDTVQEVYELPDDSGHDQLPVGPCCSGLPQTPSLPSETAHRRLLRLCRR